MSDWRYLYHITFLSGIQAPLFIRPESPLQSPQPQSGLTLCKAMHYSLPGYSVHGILQARILEQVAVPFSRGSTQPRARTPVSCITGRFFTIWATRKAKSIKPQESTPDETVLSLTCKEFSWFCGWMSDFLPLGNCSNFTRLQRPK